MASLDYNILCCAVERPEVTGYLGWGNAWEVATKTCGRYKTLCQVGKLNIPQSIIVLYWLHGNDNICIYWVDNLVFKSTSIVSFCFLRRQNFPPVTWCCFCMKCPFRIKFTRIFTFPFITVWRSHPVKIAFRFLTTQQMRGSFHSTERRGVCNGPFPAENLRDRPVFAHHTPLCLFSRVGAALQEFR